MKFSCWQRFQSENNLKMIALVVALLSKILSPCNLTTKLPAHQSTNACEARLQVPQRQSFRSQLVDPKKSLSLDHLQIPIDTVDGRNPAPPGMYKTRIFTTSAGAGFLPSTVSEESSFSSKVSLTVSTAIASIDLYSL